MKVEDSLNINFLYANGFYKSNIDLESADKILEYIQTEEWQEDVEASSIVLNPNWDNEKPVHILNAPLPYQKFLDSFLKTKFLESYNQMFGEFTAMGVALHRTPKGYVNAWHGHFMDGFHIHLLFHFSKDERTEDDGGLIEFGLVLDSSDYHLSLDDYNQIPPKNVFRTGSFISKHGQFEVLLNSHPMYSHQVTEVVTDKDRYTLMILLGYKENMLESKKFVKNL